MRADLWMDKSKEIESLPTGQNSVIVSGEKGRATCLGGRVPFSPVVMIYGGNVGGLLRQFIRTSASPLHCSARWLLWIPNSSFSSSQPRKSHCERKLETRQTGVRGFDMGAGGLLTVCMG